MLKIENIHCGYKNDFRLEGISFEAKQKEIIGIIGPNGSGKTTLLRAITKILPLASGRIIFGGEDLADMSYKHIAQNIALASSDMETGFDISAEEFVALGRIPHQNALQLVENKKDAQVIEQAMAMTGIENLRKRPLRYLSAGERQMAVIAKALAQEPKLLLLDEPVVHLDISHQAYILNLIKRLHKTSGLTVIIVLHELNLASEYCDKLVLLNAGRMYKRGAPAEVFQQRIINDLYKTKVQIAENPLSGKPYVFIVAEQ